MTPLTLPPLEVLEVVGTDDAKPEGLSATAASSLRMRHNNPASERAAKAAIAATLACCCFIMAKS